VRSSRDLVADENATAERAAVDHLWLPVLRAADERRWEIALVVDASPSMLVWHQTIVELTGLLQRLGVFCSVHVRLLHTATTHPAGVWVRGASDNAVSRPPGEVVDPAGRRVVLTLTDGSSEGWRNGSVEAVLRSWALVGPVAIVQVMPQQFWHQTGLAVRRLRLRAAGPGAANGRVRWRLRESGVFDPDANTTGAVPIPVLELGARWLGPWTQLLAGVRPRWISMTGLLARPWSAQQSPAPDTDTAGTNTKLPPRDRVALFRAKASPTAFNLATHLAAAPLNLPVARMVQAVLLPRSQISHLAEVLNSGLLQQTATVDGPAAVDQVTLEFHDGIREELLSFGQRADTARVVRAVDAYLGPLVAALQGLGQALDDPDAAGRPMTSGDEAFVRVEQAVMRALSGPQPARARQLERAMKEPRSIASTNTSRQAIGSQTGEAVMTTTPAPQTESVGAPRTPATPEPAIAVRTNGSHHEPADATVPPALPHTDPKVRRTSQPTVWGSIPPRNPNFTGRGELLESLHQRLTAGTTAVLPEALHGMGGVGKSQLAVEYVYRHQADYDLIWWIPAERPAQIGQALGELARRLNLPVGAEVNAAVPAVREILRTGRPYTNWLLVFDNAESPEAVRPFFPTGGPGCILVTSRDPRWATIARTLEVNVFTRQESTELLRRRGPELSLDDADRLAVALGDLPLAIEQAAAWRAETGMPAEEYLHLLEERRPDLLDDSPPLDYPTTVAAAWNVSLDTLRERNPGAWRLLQLCAFLAPEPISRMLFTSARGTDINPELDVTLRDPIQFSRAVREINRYALARIDHRTNSIQMHRLVQRVLIGQMTPEERETMEHGTHVLLASSDPNQPDATANWPRYADLYSHVIASGAIECGDGWVRQLVLNEAKYLWRWGDAEGGRDIAQRAYDVWRRQLGEEDQETLKMAQWLGFMLFVAGRYAEASELNAATLESYRRVLGEEHEDTLEVMQAVAADRRVQGEFTAALEISNTIYQRSLRTFGADDPITLKAAHNLGVSLRLASEFKRAQALDSDTSQCYVQILGEDHPDSLYTRLGLIIDQRELGDYATACTELEELVARHRLLFGDENFFTLRAVRTLSVTRRKAGDHAGALACSEDAHLRLSKQYGDDHPETMSATLDLSTDRRQNGDLRSARELGRMTHERYRRTFGEDHPHTIGAALNLATTHRQLGDVEEAYKVDSEGLRRLRTNIGDDHILTLSCAVNLSSDLFARGDFQDAYDNDSDARDRLRRRVGEDHPLTILSSLNLAIDLRALGRTDEAQTLHARTMRQYEQVLGPNHKATQEAGKWVRATCDMYPMPL
jgi:tetratricopeptide (TPR) repeat protein